MALVDFLVEKENCLTTTDSAVCWRPICSPRGVGEDDGTMKIQEISVMGGTFSRGGTRKKTHA